MFNPNHKSTSGNNPPTLLRGWASINKLHIIARLGQYGRLLSFVVRSVRNVRSVRSDGDVVGGKTSSHSEVDNFLFYQSSFQKLL